MRILVIGGSGQVGTDLIPYLVTHHDVRVLDTRPPTATGVSYVAGSATDYAAARAAAEGVDGVVYLAMGPKSAWQGTVAEAAAHFDAGPTGLYVSLRAAHDAGVGRAVYASSMSVYTGEYGLGPIDPAAEDYPEPDATNFYGLAKRLGEQVCEAISIEYGMTVVALRLASPRADDVWQRYTEEPYTVMATAASDVAAAVEAALRCPSKGFLAVPVTGDHEGRYMNLAITKKTLGWAPAARRDNRKGT